jgi:glucose/arabinose dehydrogenase
VAPRTPGYHPRRRAITVLAAVALAAAPAAANAAPRLQPVASGLSNPVHVAAPSGDSRLFIVEQEGRIRVLRAGKLTTFLDIRQLVASGGEKGLLSVAFHPNFATNGRFYVDYTALGPNGLVTRIVQYRAQGNRALPGSARVLLRILQPYENHNGGQLAFGPDGLLYIGMGDGGSGGDPENRAQNPQELLGKILRIDVDHRTGGRQYAIPATNPYRRGGGRPEIWALGVRNPWRFSFDRQTGDLWIGDVGQGNIEEIDFVKRGTGGLLNFGWDAFEGRSAYEPKPTPGRLIPPVSQYPHSQGCSITGGFVVRSASAPSLRGRYVYADYCQSWIRSIRKTASGASRPVTHAGVGGITSFGEGGNGDVYVVSSATGRVYRLVG